MDWHPLSTRKNLTSCPGSVDHYRLLLKDERYEFSTVLERSVGWGITRANPDKPIQMTKVTIIIKFAEYNHMPYFIVSAFPSI
uniref:RNase A-like domain-containing protein n=1 Tax=Pseudomonas viridiflava TaxID=33069 RepID=UPI003BF8EE5A